MPNVVTENTDNLTSVITVNVPREDYEQKLTNKLKETRKAAQIKGFRKGKVPMSFIKKNYGQAMLADIINDLMQEEMVKTMEEAGDKHLGQPIPTEDQKQYNFDTKNLEDFEFKFEIGLKPDFKVAGIDKKKAYNYYTTQIPAKTIDDEIANARKRAGERVLDEEKIVDGDMIKFDAKELDGKKVKEGGIQNEFSLLWDKIDNDKLKKQLLKKKVGETVSFNVFEVEKDAEVDYVKKYILGIGEEDETSEMYEATIVEVSRINEAELNEEFFTATFGENVKTEAEARTFLEGEIGKSHNKTADALLFRDIQDRLMEVNGPNMPLPDAFMKRFLMSQSEDNTPEIVEKGYEGFADNLRWTLVRGQLFDKYEIKVEQEDLNEHFANQIRQYMGGYADAAMIQQTVDRMMQDQKMVEDAANNIATDRLMDKVKDDLKLKEKKVTIEELNAVVTELNEKMAAERAAEEGE
ncbi:MAG: trigger factor [Saprospiraceae bacterium]|jgi:trigger factor